MKLPCQECGGKCCAPPAMNESDARRIKRYTRFSVFGGHNFFMLEGSWDEEGNLLHVCPAFDSDKKECSIYQFRPKVCRQYGTIDALPCLYLYPDKAKIYSEEHMRSLMKKMGLNPP